MCFFKELGFLSVCFLDVCLSIYFSFSALFFFMSLFLMSFACSFDIFLYYEMFQGVTEE